MSFAEIAHHTGLWWYACILQRFQIALLVFSSRLVHDDLMCILNDTSLLIVQRICDPPHLMWRENEEYLVVILFDKVVL